MAPSATENPPRERSELLETRALAYPVDERLRGVLDACISGLDTPLSLGRMSNMPVMASVSLPSGIFPGTKPKWAL